MFRLIETTVSGIAGLDFSPRPGECLVRRDEDDEMSLRRGIDLVVGAHRMSI